jgi:hypothetical protein
MSDNKLVIIILLCAGIMASGLWYVMDKREGPNVIPLASMEIVEADQNDMAEQIAEIEEEVPFSASDAIPGDVATAGEEFVMPTPAVPVQLPNLDDSDDFVSKALADIDGGSDLVNLLVSEHIIRKYVILVENLSRGILPMGDWPISGPAQGISVRRLDNENFLMEDSSYRRFDAILNSLLAVNPVHGVRLYRLLYPLFQQGMDEIGYRGVDFNDVLIKAINNIIEAPLEDGPHLLVQPSVQFLYQDEILESRSDLEKLMIRMGSENAAKLIERAVEYKAHLMALNFR